ncbi:hypothetical protein YW5DRAFT_01682 [Streptomyces sp. Ncost-T6T-1]|nr:hypothetical protein YW5DRAFT_01682 [Streptomyces sp. Ncost-T6T-1]
MDLKGLKDLKVSTGCRLRRLCDGPARRPINGIPQSVISKAFITLCLSMATGEGEFRSRWMGSELRC